MKAIIYNGAVLGFARTAAISGYQVNTDGASYGGLDPARVQIVDADKPADFAPGLYTWDGRLRRVPAAPVVPESVLMLNAHLTLISAGWMDALTAHLAAIPGADGARARAYFNQAQTIRRNHPLVAGIPAALGKTESEVDDLFIAAGALNA